MDVDVFATLQAVGTLLYKASQKSVLFSLATVFLKIYSAVLLIDFVLIIFNRNLGEDFRKLRYGTTLHPTVSYAGAAKRWKEITSKLDGENPSHYKVAVLEADAFIERLIGKMGYEGRNLKERLDKVKEGRLISMSAIREAHEVRNRIIREEDYMLSRDDAKETLGKFQKLLDELRLLS
ncbi:MAG: hypothetical protein HGA31_04745 [Candidatus Moranbacteria bacterium]|nr:hypothetical protein [Candidatus Moranbacteria bacterium]